MLKREIKNFIGNTQIPVEERNKLINYLYLQSLGNSNCDIKNATTETIKSWNIMKETPESFDCYKYLDQLFPKKQKSGPLTDTEKLEKLENEINDLTKQIELKKAEQKKIITLSLSNKSVSELLDLMNKAK